MVLPVEQLGNISLMWVILAVVFGLLLIALIAIIMYRTGCFKTNVGDDQIDIKQYAGKSYKLYGIIFEHSIIQFLAELRGTSSQDAQRQLTTTLNQDYMSNERSVY